MLTDKAVRSARTRSRAYKIADSPGLFLFVTLGGSKSWRMRFRDADGREQTLTFGLWPEVSIDDARARRDLARAQLAAGNDPRERCRQVLLTNTFERAARAWHAHRASDWSPVHAADVMTSLESDVFPVIGDKPLGAISRPLIGQLLAAVEARGAAVTAQRLRQRISKVYKFALAKGWAIDNPADVGEAMAQVGSGGRQPALVNVDELRALMIAVSELDAAPVLRLASRFLALTTVRLGSLRAIRWGEVEDLDEREPLWRVPAAHMKLKVAAKRDAANDHLIPLSSSAAGVLRAVRSIAGGKIEPDALVFPGRGGTRAIGAGAIGELYARAGYAGRHVPHGWRASFSTVMVERHPDARAPIDLTLGHKVKDMSKVERSYNRAQLLDPRRALLEEWATILLGPVQSGV